MDLWSKHRSKFFLEKSFKKTKMEFKTYQKQAVDLIQHCQIQRKNHPETKIHIGCDSISVGGKINYFLVVAFRYGTNGAHFIYHKEIVTVTNKTRGKWGVFMKLRHEGELTIQVANLLVDSGISKDDIILELDFNNVVSTLYNGLIPEIQGMATSMGFHTMVKFKDDLYRGQVVTEDLIAVKAADHLCQGVA